MSPKGIIKLSFTLLFLLSSLYTLIFVMYPEYQKAQKSTAKIALYNLLPEIERGRISNKSIAELPPNFFNAIWLKTPDEWVPIMYDNDVVKKINLQSPMVMPTGIRAVSNIYYQEVGGKRFVLWINKFNFEYLFKHIILMYLFIVLIYLIILTIIELLIKEQPKEAAATGDLTPGDLDTDFAAERINHAHDNDDDISVVLDDNTLQNGAEEEDETAAGDLTIIEQDGSELRTIRDIPKEPGRRQETYDYLSEKLDSQRMNDNELVITHHNDMTDTIEALDTDDFTDTYTARTEEEPVEEEPEEPAAFERVEPEVEGECEEDVQAQLLEKFKTYWNKNYNITDDFKKKFDFNRINKLIRFGIMPDAYIREVLEVADRYFKWKKSGIYINQQETFVDMLSREVLDKDTIILPMSSSSKGLLYIPLYPYNSESLYGYFYFEWEYRDDFHLSDILYFLKFVFSDKAKSIFFNYTILDGALKKLNGIIDSKRNAVFAILEADDKEKYEQQFKKPALVKITNMAQDALTNHLVQLEVVRINPLTYAVYGSIDNKNSFMKKLQSWMEDDNIQNYPVSDRYGNIALTFSCGLAVSDMRRIHPLALINEAEVNLKKAISNQIVG